MTQSTSGASHAATVFKILGGALVLAIGILSARLYLRDRDRPPHDPRADRLLTVARASPSREVGLMFSSALGRGDVAIKFSSERELGLITHGDDLPVLVVPPALIADADRSSQGREALYRLLSYAAARYRQWINRGVALENEPADARCPSELTDELEARAFVCHEAWLYGWASATGDCQRLELRAVAHDALERAPKHACHDLWAFYAADPRDRLPHVARGPDPALPPPVSTPLPPPK